LIDRFIPLVARGSNRFSFGNVAVMEDKHKDSETEVAGVEVHPPEGEQDSSHESDETLSPDERSGGEGGE
jgi:hypothetical protein